MILFERPQHLVVCHTIPDKEVQEVLEAAHTLRPTMSNLILETTRSMRSLAEKDRVLSIFAGSRVMLDVLIADVNAAAPPN